MEYVGPLMCGGITTFTPFMDFGVKPYHRIAVVGIGGKFHQKTIFLDINGKIRLGTFGLKMGSGMGM